MRGKPNLGDDAKAQIEFAIGRQLCPGRRGSVRSFEDLTDSDLDDLKPLWNDNGLLCIDYIEFLLPDTHSLRTMVSFCNIVLSQGISVDNWIGGFPSLKL